MPLLLLAASLNVDFKLCKGSVLPFAKEILSFLSYIKRFDNIRGTVKHIPNILMTQELDAKYNSSSTSHTSVKLSLPLLRLAALSRRYQNLLHTVSILYYPLYLNCEPCGRYNSSSQTPPALKSYTMNIRKLQSCQVVIVTKSKTIVLVLYFKIGLVLITDELLFFIYYTKLQTIESRTQSNSMLSCCFPADTTSTSEIKRFCSSPLLVSYPLLGVFHQLCGRKTHFICFFSRLFKMQDCNRQNT